MVSKIAVDQLLSAPLGTVVFFASMKWLEGRSNEITSQIQVNAPALPPIARLVTTIRVPGASMHSDPYVRHA